MSASSSCMHALRKTDPSLRLLHRMLRQSPKHAALRMTHRWNCDFQSLNQDIKTMRGRCGDARVTVIGGNSAPEVDELNVVHRAAQEAGAETFEFFDGVCGEEPEHWVCRGGLTGQGEVAA